jgi:hypothetical protein
MVLHLIDMDSDEEKESIDANYLLLDNDDPSEQASLQQTELPAQSLPLLQFQHAYDNKLP